MTFTYIINFNFLVIVISDNDKKNVVYRKIFLETTSIIYEIVQICVNKGYIKSRNTIVVIKSDIITPISDFFDRWR